MASNRADASVAASASSSARRIAALGSVLGTSARRSAAAGRRCHGHFLRRSTRAGSSFVRRVRPTAPPSSGTGAHGRNGRTGIIRLPVGLRPHRAAPGRALHPLGDAALHAACGSNSESARHAFLHFGHAQRRLSTRSVLPECGKRLLRDRGALRRNPAARPKRPSLGRACVHPSRAVRAKSPTARPYSGAAGAQRARDRSAQRPAPSAAAASPARVLGRFGDELARRELRERDLIDHAGRSDLADIDGEPVRISGRSDGGRTMRVVCGLQWVCIRGDSVIGVPRPSGFSWLRRDHQTTSPSRDRRSRPQFPCLRDIYVECPPSITAPSERSAAGRRVTAPGVHGTRW